MRRGFGENWKPLGRRQAYDVLRLLREARESATMKNASFGGFGKEGEKKTKEIKEETRLYRQSWIISPLDRVINQLESLYKL